VKKTPCEYIVWNVLPCIRKKFAEELLARDLSQREVAGIIGVSSAAISQYLSNKRGRADELDASMADEIARSVDALLAGGDITDELCRICTIFKHKKDIKDIVC
jgi:hypothetical protein